MSQEMDDTTKFRYLKEGRGPDLSELWDEWRCVPKAREGVPGEKKFFRALKKVKREAVIATARGEKTHEDWEQWLAQQKRPDDINPENRTVTAKQDLEYWEDSLPIKVAEILRDWAQQSDGEYYYVV
jgi:hypothetical protein